MLLIVLVLSFINWCTQEYKMVMLKTSLVHDDAK